MIIYVTKQTFERYKLKMPEDFSDHIAGALVKSVIQRESGNAMLEWGGKLFYLDRKKCLVVTHFASKITLVLVDIKMADIENLGMYIEHYMFDIYKDNPKVTHLLERLFKENPVLCFSKLKDKRIIATLNHTLSWDLFDGYRLYDYIKDGILNTHVLNKDINRKWLFGDTIDGKKEYIYPAERFEELLCEYYGMK